MKKHYANAILTLFGMLFGLGVLHAKAYPSADNVCIRHISAPTYPRLPWFAQLTGTVDVDIEVDTDGKVRSAISSGAHNLLNHAAEENVQKWTFCPSVGGLKLRVTYTYRLEGQKEPDQSPPRVSFDLPDHVEIVARPPEPIP